MEDVPASVEGPVTNPSWQRVQLARHPKRPHSRDYIDRLITGFEELHGDRHFGDDKSIVAGFGHFEQMPVMIIGHSRRAAIRKRSYSAISECRSQKAIVRRSG